MKIERIPQITELYSRRKKLVNGLEKNEDISDLHGGLYFVGHQGQSVSEYLYSVGLLMDKDTVTEMFRHWVRENIKSELEEVDRQLIELGVEL